MSRQNNPVNEVGIFTSTNSWSGIPENDYVHGLLTGGVWGDNDPDNGSVTDLSYYLFENEYFDSRGGDIVYGYKWEEYETRIILETMGAFEDVANISFTETDNRNTANISWASLDDSDSDGYLGWAYVPLSQNGNHAGITTINFGSYFSNTMEADGVLDLGSYYFLTFIHELGHSLGLGHPHGSNNYYGTFSGVDSSSDGGDNGLNASPYTVMTYNDVDANSYVPNSISYSGFSTNLGAFDIAAIQYLYGANESTNSGDDIYELTTSLNGYQCIWDVGGEDTIDATNASAATTIDLRNATLNNETGGGGFVSKIDSDYVGYTIAYGTSSNSISCIIENATGSNYDDVITGNSSANILKGERGADTLHGGKGADTLRGGLGLDTLYGNSGADIIYGGADADTISGGSAADTLYGDNGDDTIYGGTGADKLYGGKGDDSLNGDSAFDTLFGNSGDDTLRGGKGSDTLNGGTGSDTLFGNTGDDTIHGGGDADIISGGGGVDTIYGDSGSDNIKGGGGIDTIFGGTAADTLYGENDDDTIYGGTGADKLYGGKGDDSLNGDSAFDTLYGNSGDDTLRGGKGSDTISGGTGADTIFGNTGDDTINGGADADIISGGGGNDTISGGSGNDQIKGGGGSDIFQIGTGSGRDLITDYQSGTDSVELLGDVAESDLTFSYSGGDTRISYDNDLLAIVENITSASDITFI